MRTHYGDAVRGADASSDTGRLVRRNFTCLPHPQRAVFSFLKTDVKRGTEGTVKKNSRNFSQVPFFADRSV